MNYIYEIEYKLTAKSPILNPACNDGKFIIYCSSINGAIRSVYRRLNSKNADLVTALDEEGIFGDEKDGIFHSSSFYVTDAICHNCTSKSNIHSHNFFQMIYPGRTLHIRMCYA